MHKTIAEIMREVLLEHGEYFVCWGDLNILDECSSRCTHTNLSEQHPLVRHNRILNALEKSPLFQKRRISIAGERGRQFIRGFWLVEHQEEKQNENNINSQ